MRLKEVDVVKVEPVLEAQVDEVLRLRVDLLVREGDIEGVEDALSLEGQPSAVAGDVGQELLFVAGRTERRETYPPLLGIAVGGTLSAEQSQTMSFTSAVVMSRQS